MSFATIANGLAISQAHESVRDLAEARQQSIERLRERTNVQKELYGSKIEPRRDPLRPPNELLNYALEQLKTKETLAERYEACFRALAVCNTFETSQEAVPAAARVWSGALLADLQYLRSFILASNEIDVTKVVEQTVLGKLYAAVSDEADFVDIMLNDAVCEGILGKLGEDQGGVSRLLRTLRAWSKDSTTDNE